MKIIKRFVLTKFFFILLTAVCSFSSNIFANSTQAFKKPFISYTDVGEGEPLVLIHAFPTDQRLWEPQRAGLKQHFRVITLDLWGFGNSSAPTGQAVSMADYADEVKQLLDQLRIQKAIIGGESMGGYIALAFLEKYPGQVSGMVLSDTQSIADSLEAKSKREATAVDVLEHGSANLIKEFIPKALTSDAPAQMRELLQNILESQLAISVASALRGMALRDDISHVLEASALPILIITGEEDALISPQQSENMHLLAKNSQLVTIAHAAHLSSFEKSQEWNQAVIKMFYKSK